MTERYLVTEVIFIDYYVEANSYEEAQLLGDTTFNQDIEGLNLRTVFGNSDSVLVGEPMVDRIDKNGDIL